MIKGWDVDAVSADQLILNQKERDLDAKVKITALLRETGDDDILGEISEEDSEDVALGVMYSICDSASVNRKRQIRARYVRMETLNRKNIQHKRAAFDHQAKQADHAINNILYGITQRVERAARSTADSLKVDVSPLEQRVELSPQVQLDRALDTVKAADHLLRLGGAAPKLTSNQQLAIDYLKEVRASNEATFKTIRDRLEIHHRAGCKISQEGQVIHKKTCTDQELSGTDLLQSFRYGMSEIQPATRHAMRVLLGRPLTNPLLDYT